MEEGFNHPMGPFKVIDLIGVDLTLDFMKRTYKNTGVKPAMFDDFVEMVDKCLTGRNAGKGFYEYK